MKKKTIILFPAIYTLILALSTNLVPSPLDSKGLIAISLVMLFPVLILIQSMISALNHLKVWLPLGTSILATMLFIITLHIGDTRGLFSTMYYYSAIYLIAGIVGYVIGKVICKLKSSKKVVKEVY